MTWIKVKVRRRIPQPCLKRSDDIYHRMMIRTPIILTFIVALCGSSFLCGRAFGEDSWSFVAIGDSRGNYATTTTGVSEYLPTIASKIASLNPSAVLFIGDLINGNDVPKKDGEPIIPYATQFVNWKAAMKPVYDKPAIAIYPVRGNHENIASDNAAPISALKQAYYDAFGATVPQNGPNNGAGDNQVGFSWDLKLKNVRIVTADQYFYFHETPVGGRNYFEIDQAWVDKQLSKTAPRPYTFVMAHEPVYSLSHEEGGFYGTSAQGIASRDAFWDSLGDNGSEMYLTAHVHSLQVGTAVDGSGNVIYQNMMGNGGAPLGDPADSNLDPLLTPTYSNFTDYGFSLFTVTNSNITETYYLYDPTLDKWTVAAYTITLVANKVSTWSTASGTFSDVFSWDPGTVPDATYTAVFDRGAGISSTSNFTASANNKRLFVASGSVTFNLAGNTYTTDSAAIDGSEYASYCPSLTISGAGSRFNPTVLTMDGVTSSLVVGAGASATSDRITIEGGTATLGGNITANDYINLADSGANQTLKISSGSNITGNLLSGALGADTGGTRGTLEFEGSAIVNGNIGEGGTESFKLITVGNGSVTMNGDIRATTINFAGDNDLHIGDGYTLTTGAGSGVTATTGGQGTLIFDGSATVNSNVGAGAWGTHIKEVRVAASDSTVTLNGTFYADTITINNATATAVIGSSGTSAVSNLNLTTGSLDLGANTLTLGAAAAGNYTQAAGTTLKLTINSATANDNGNLVVGGTTTVVDKGKVYVTVPTGFTIANGTTYTIITMNGTVATGADLAVTSNTRRYVFTATKDGKEWVITSSEGSYVAPAGASGNESSVGNALNSITNPSGDMNNVLDQLGTLSDPEYDQALDTMHPDVSSGSADGSRSLTGQGFTTVSNRLGGARSGGTSGGISSGDMLNGVGVWMQALGSNMKQGERKGVEGYSGNLFGTTVGADKVIDDHFRAGFAGSYGWARVKSKTSGSPSDDINSYQATLYGSFDSLDLNKARQHGKRSYEAVRSQVENSWYVDGMMAFTQNNYDSRREIWLAPTSKRVAKADHYGQQYSTNFEVGYKFVFEKTKALEVTPFASLGYNFLYLNRYKENGANALNLSVQGKGFNQLEQGLGTKLAYPMVAKKVGTFIPSVKAAWLYDYIADRFETTASFAGGGSSFDTPGAKPAKNGMLFGTELAFLNKGNMTLTGNWDIELKDQFMSNTYYGTARFDF